MSPIALSDHIPDIDLITIYAERQQGWFSHISPWTKLVILVFIIFIITISHNFLILITLYSLTLLVYWNCKLPLRKLVGWYLMPVLFVVSLVGLLIWNEPGSPIITLPLGIAKPVLTDKGILLFGILLIKALITFTYSILFLMTTRYQHLSNMISRLFPAPLDQITLMAYRFLFLTLSMIHALTKSVLSRGGGFVQSLKIQGVIFAQVAGLTIIRSFEQAERVNKAMESRGYSAGSYGSRSLIPTPSFWEYLLILGAFCIIILIEIPKLFGSL